MLILLSRASAVRNDSGLPLKAANCRFRDSADWAGCAVIGATGRRGYLSRGIRFRMNSPDDLKLPFRNSQELLDNCGVELRTGHSSNLFHGGGNGLRRPIGPVGGNRVKGVHDGEDPRASIDFACRESAWIAGAIEILVMAVNYLRDTVHIGDCFQLNRGLWQGGAS